MAGHRCRSRCPWVGDTLSRSRRAQAPAERSDAVANRVLVRHASCGSLADATRSLADRASARCTRRLVGVRPQVSRSVSERRSHAFRRATARDANRRRQLGVRPVGDRCHRPLANARETRAAYSGPYSRRPSAWDLLPAHGRVFHAHRRVPCRDRSADGAPRRDRWRRMRSTRDCGCGCDPDAAARRGCRFGSAASSCSGPTSCFKSTKKNRVLQYVRGSYSRADMAAASSGVGGGLARASGALHRCARTCVVPCAFERVPVGVQGRPADRATGGSEGAYKLVLRLPTSMNLPLNEVGATEKSVQHPDRV